jgi:PKD repeat protein
MGKRCSRHGLSLAAACLVLAILPGSAAAKARPDLKIAKLTAGPAQTRAADPILVVDTTTNAGKGKAKGSENGYYLSRDEQAGDDDELLGRRSVKKLKRRKRSEGAQELTIPAGASGNYRLIACADDAGKVKEKKEQNNCRASGPITVAPEEPPPDDNQAPFANLDYSPAVPQTGETVQFTSLSTDPDGTIAELAWDLDGDGAYDDATGADPTQAYATAGTYTVGLRATDNEGTTDVDLRELTVVAAPDPDLDDDGTPNESDCEPNDPAIHPAADDPLEAPYTDSNCDGVDGVASEAIYVSPDGINSAARGTTLSDPVATINFALTRAQATARTKIFIAGGTYEEVITVVNGTSMFGGFAPGDGEWGRSAGNPTTILNRAMTFNDVTGLLAANVTTATRLQLLRVVAGSTSATGGSSYGIRASNSPGLTLDTVTVEAGNGAAGATGGPGTNGFDGPNGGDGNPGLCANPFTGGTGGTKGTASDAATDVSGGIGGAGGSPGQNGAAGAAGTGPSPGSAGTAGTGSSAGGDGGDGADGADGSNGSAGNGGSVSGGKWVSSAGGSGGNGGSGSGGGGGGGGAGINTPQTTGGAGGGGGGAGGGRGTGGGGGSGGGGSFGLFVTNSSPGPGPTVLASTISSGDGGSGGIGGLGAPGGTGGLGGDPGGFGPGCTIITVAGLGGDGGDGGDGGYGGGGAGGPSFGIFAPSATVTNTAGYLTSGNSFDHGSGGSGGPSLGNVGNSGAAANSSF